MITRAVRQNRQAIKSICRHLGYAPPDFSTFGDGTVYQHLGDSDPNKHPITASELRQSNEVLYALIDHLGLEIVQSHGVIIKKKGSK